MYDAAEGETSREKINAQKRTTYAERKEREKGLTSGGGAGILQPSTEKVVLELDDIRVGRGLGAAQKSYDIEDLKTGEHFDLYDGSHLEKASVFAGKGVDVPYRNAFITEQIDKSFWSQDTEFVDELVLVKKGKTQKEFKRK